MRTAGFALLITLTASCGPAPDPFPGTYRVTGYLVSRMTDPSGTWWDGSFATQGNLTITPHQPAGHTDGGESIDYDALLHGNGNGFTYDCSFIVHRTSPVSARVIQGSHCMVPVASTTWTTVDAAVTQSSLTSGDSDAGYPGLTVTLEFTGSTSTTRGTTVIFLSGV